MNAPSEIPKIETILSPELSRLHDFARKSVVIIDILRATSTICESLYNGAKSIEPVLTKEEALALKTADNIICGERNGEKVEGFDLGNSPKTHTSELVSGKELVLTTTNGTRAIHDSREADNILIGSFFNISALADYLKSQSSDLIVFCAGWKGNPNLEDTLFAGELIHHLADAFDLTDDASQICLSVYNQATGNYFDCLKDASHPKRFKRLDVYGELEYCLQRDICPIVPRIQGGKIIA
jgi:2-phosphosulfolactate phosphatase